MYTHISIHLYIFIYIYNTCDLDAHPQAGSLDACGRGARNLDDQNLDAHQTSDLLKHGRTHGRVRNAPHVEPLRRPLYCACRAVIGASRAAIGACRAVIIERR